MYFFFNIFLEVIFFLSFRKIFSSVNVRVRKTVFKERTEWDRVSLKIFLLHYEQLNVFTCIKMLALNPTLFVLLLAPSQDSLFTIHNSARLNSTFLQTQLFKTKNS